MPLKIGDRVVRGANWNPAFENQDGFPGNVGTVLTEGRAWKTVRWDNVQNTNAYLDEHLKLLSTAPEDIFDFLYAADYKPVKEKKKDYFLEIV